MRTVTRYIGRCGVCEGDYKLLAGKLVHHGYRRPGHGYIVGDCFGVGYAPLEVSTAASADYRESCERGLEGLQSYLRRLRAGEVRELTVYKTVYRDFGRQEVPVTLRRDSGDREEVRKFEVALENEIRGTERHQEFFKLEVTRMSRLINAWVERPIRTVEEFERAVAAVLAEERGKRQAERSEKHRARDEKRAALDEKRARWEEEKRALMDKYRARFTEYAEDPAANRERAREAWSEMYRAKKRKGYLDFYPRELDVDDALMKLRLARSVDRPGGRYTEYAPGYAALF